VETPPESFDLKNVVTSNRLMGLWVMLTGYKRIYILATISVGVAAVFRTSFFYLLRYFTDEVLGNEQLQVQLPFIAVGFVTLSLVQGAFTFMSGRWSAAASEGVTARLRDYLFDHIQRLSFAYHDKTPTGQLIQRVTSDVDALRRFYAEQAIGAGRITLLFLVNFIALLSLNVRLALFSVVLIPLVLLTSVLFFRRITERYEAFQEQEAKLSTTLQENLTGIRVVRAFARQEFERQKFEADNQERFNRGRRLLLMHAFFWPSTDVLVGAQMILGYAVGAVLAIDGEISLGTYLAYLGILGWIIWPMRHLGRLIVQMSIGLVSFGRVVEIVRERRETLDWGQYQPEGEVRGEMVFKEVCFSYDDGTAVLKNISFEVKPGQVVALVGGTGSGKTSLVNLLPRFYKYDTGSILLDGIELYHYPRHYLRQQIGIVQQEPFLFSRSVRENITYGVGRVCGDDEVKEAAKAAAIHDVILEFPQGYDTVVGEKGVTLSGGQKQRLTIARTMLKDPRLLILDDATSSVDTETEAAIRGALEMLIPGRTTFIIAHRIQTVMSADLILVLQDGEIAQKGDHETLLAQEGTYRQLFNLQSRIEDELQEDLRRAIT
jgi:ATP-binding cassette subfamily B protein